MARVTKAILEEREQFLMRENIRLNGKIAWLEEKVEILRGRHFDADAFCRMHAEGMSAVAQVVTDLRTLLQRRKLD